MDQNQGAEMTIDLALVIKQLQRQLDGLEGRRRMLQVAIEGLKPLVAEDDEPQLPGLAPTVSPAPAGQAKPSIPAGFFAGKTPTQAYRELMHLWPAQYSPPQIAEAFIAGGMTKTRPELVQQIHSVLKRERKRARREKEGTE